MRLISNRARAALLLAAAFCAGLLILVATFAANAGKYVMYNVNAHLYSGGSLVAGGEITDRNGAVLSKMSDGKRAYSSDSAVRKATLHTVGDRYGFIAAGVQKNYMPELVGYNLVLGIYNAETGGNDIKLTLDSKVCAAAYKALDGRKGTVGVYNYKTGEIVCMVSAPTYDVNDVPSDIDNNTTGKYEGIYMNRLLSGLYAPGSVFKIVTAACAIDNIPGLYSRTFTCTGKYETGDGTVTCSGAHGSQTFEKAFVNSCNSAFAEMAIELGGKKLADYAKKMGIASNYTVNKVKTAAGSVSLSDASKADIGWAGIGQHTDMANPLTMMVISGAAANGDTAAMPYFISEITNPSGMKVYSAKTESTGKIFPMTTANSIKGLMRAAVKDNYG
ncbi:MAG: penicillin-binding transpeptidase domain-containing protein, partial [Oscillospiraceae bacterium]|nr:penicillin-binding transpeptidase domain-containing protein [Oscillospiraceae bacterium]